MIFFKPAWINHEDNKPIFSVDVHPKGNRFATGGQGGSGGRIVIWNVNPVINENDESNPKVAKMLCQMDNHLACVNVVRWSNSGHFLASGSDDKLVMIWRLTSEGNSSIFGSNKVNVETWKCIHTLNSHNGDVLDLSWAPHDGWLASGSVDNTVIIWNAQKFPEKVAVLKNHTGMVKGVTWDPVGKYLASQSDDKSLRIWRTSDWAQQEVVTDPFQDCSATTHVLRCSWSPDGQYLVSSHAMNGGGPTAQIIEREGWKQDKDFVGHRKAVTCVRFNSNILKKPSPDSPKKATQYCCAAIGSRDRSISVWLTSLKRPLVVVKDLFDDSVLDISWSSRGDFLLACSWDGTVACVMFEQSEIGVPLTLEEKNALYERVYHKPFQSGWSLNFSSSQIVEDPELLCALDEINQKSKSINIEPVEMKDPPKAKDICYESPKLNQSVLVPVNKQVETRLPSGKRRITPMLLTTVPTTSNDSTKNSLLINTDSTQFFSQSDTFSKSSPSKSLIIVEKRTEPQVRPIVSSQPKPAIHKSDTVVSKPPGTEINQLMCAEVPGDEPITKFINVMDPLKLPHGTTVTKDAGTLKLKITNSCHKVTNNTSLSRIEVCKGSEKKDPLWETYLGSPIRIVASNRKFVIACCEDLTINIYDIKSGARPLPPLLIEDLVSCLSLSQTGYLLVLTKTGLTYMWDLTNTRSVLTRISVRSLLSGRATVSGCSLTPANQPILTLSDGRAYSYSLDLQTWVQLSNPLDPVSRSGVAMVKKVPNNLPLASLQRLMPQYRPTDSTLPPGVTLSFLESQITATNVLQSVPEYRHWLLAQVNYLLDKGPECRLKLILDDLLGPTHSSVKKRKLDTDIMVMVLLKAMGSHLKQATAGNVHRIREFELEKVNLIEEFDILQIVGEGWFGKILLVEHKATDTEMVLKALPKPYTPLKDFYREFHYGLHLGVHKHIISTYDVAFETAGFYVFSQEYAPLGDLTSNVSEIGIGELHTKRVAKQLASALEHIHSRDLVHRDIKLDNILVFKSDFSRIKLCDFGETRRTGSVVLRRNEWLPYAAPEILEVPTDENYKCNTSHDVWQFGVVIFVCLTGCLPWQKAAQDDPRYVRYLSWQNSTLPIKRQPKLFKLVSSKAQRFFKRYLEPKAERRPADLSDVSRYLDDRWMSKGMEKTNETLKEEDGLCPSMYSFHSSPEEKNKLLFTLTQYGLEATVDRSAKKDRIRQWIQNSIIPEEEGIEEDMLDEENIKIHDHQNGPIGEQVTHRGPIAEHRVRRHHSHHSERRILNSSVEKVYKPPVDPRIPLASQKTSSSSQINKNAFQQEVKEQNQEQKSEKTDTKKSSTTAEVLRTSKTSTAKLLSYSQSGVLRTNGQMHRRLEVRTPQKNTNSILNALPFKNVRIVPNSPTTSSDSAISSDSSTVKFNLNQLPQNNKTVYAQLKNK